MAGKLPQFGGKFNTTCGRYARSEESNLRRNWRKRSIPLSPACMLSFGSLKGVHKMQICSTYPQGHRGSAPHAQAPVPLWVSARHEGEFRLIEWLSVGTALPSQGSHSELGDAGSCDVRKDRLGESSIARWPSGSESRGRAFGVLDSPFVHSPNSCWLAQLMGPRIYKEGH